MAWQDLPAQRLVLDAGAHNFRGKRCGGESTTHLLSRLVWERKSGRLTALRPGPAVEDEAGQSFRSPFTREALTDFVAFNYLLETLLAEEGVPAEKRCARALALTYTARGAEPPRVTVNRLEHLFELVGLGAV